VASHSSCLLFMHVSHDDPAMLPDWRSFQFLAYTPLTPCLTADPSIRPCSDGLPYGQYCKICPHNRVAQDQTLPDYTIVYGDNQRRTEKAGLEELRAKAVEKHVETLKGMGMR